MKQKAYTYIRFSSKEQEKGDSFNRQKKLSEDYALKHDLEIDNSIDFHDLGISAFHGDNQSKGMLNTFIQLVDNGKVKKGSYLLVESFDRISRQEVMNANILFSNLIVKGITIVTLNDGKKYNLETINRNPLELHSSLWLFINAHEESKRKSERLRHAWKTKRENANEKPITAKCPAWLELDKSNNKWMKKTDRVKIIKEIFDLKNKGIGAERIARIFNERETPTWGNGTKKGLFWRASYIKKILKSRSVIGEYQPHSIKDGKRIPDGDVIENYYPVIIKKATFEKAQSKTKNNPIKGGRFTLNNLFTGLCKCGYCGGNVVFSNKGKWRYLVCDNARIGKIHPNESYNYYEFELTFLYLIEQLNVKKLLDETSDFNKELENVEESIHITESNLNGKESQRKELLEVYKSSSKNNKGTREFLLDNLDTISSEMEEIQLQLQRFNEEKQRLNEIHNNMESHIKDIQELTKFMHENEGKDCLYEIRLKLRNRIQEIVKEIIIYPVGKGDELEYINILTESYERFYSEQLEKSLKSDDIRNLFKKKDFRYYTVELKNGAIDKISPENIIEIIRDSAGEISEMILPCIPQE